MNFRLSSEQELLRDSARRYLAADGVSTTGQRGGHGGSDAWAQFAALGWLAMLVPEEAGGLGSTLEDVAVLCEEFGRSLSREAFVGSAVLPVRIMDRCTSSALRMSTLACISQDKIRVGVALYEPGRRFNLTPRIEAVALPDGGYLLSGKKVLVAGGARATHLIVSARATGATDRGTVLLLIDIERAGVGRSVYQTLDQAEAADFTFDRTPVIASERIAGTDTAFEITEDAVDDAIICLSAEMLGGMDRAIELTSEYLKFRKQFGRALGEFQALQHAAAEMWMDANSARSILYQAIAAPSSPRRLRQKAVAGCGLKVLQTAKSLTGTAVHLHGGIGITCEYPVGHFLRRSLVAERMFGDREHLLARYLAADHLAGSGYRGSGLRSMV